MLFAEWEMQYSSVDWKNVTYLRNIFVKALAKISILFFTTECFPNDFKHIVINPQHSFKSKKEKQLISNQKNIDIKTYPSQNSPHCCAVKMDHQPFAWIESNGISKLNSLHPFSEFRADKSGSGISSINMKPKLFFLANWSKLL